MKKKVLVIILIVLALSSSAFGLDVTSGKWWRNKLARKELALRKETIEKLDNQNLDSRRKLIDLKASVQKAQIELDTILERENLDEEAALTTFKNLEKARFDLATERFRYLLAIRKLLGYERFNRITAHFKQLQNKKKAEETLRENRSNRTLGFESPE